MVPREWILLTFRRTSSGPDFHAVPVLHQKRSALGEERLPPTGKIGRANHANSTRGAFELVERMPAKAGKRRLRRSGKLMADFVRSVLHAYLRSVLLHYPF